MIRKAEYKRALKAELLAHRDASVRVVALEAALKDAIEFADEGWAYASPYFVEKWDYKGQREKLCGVLTCSATSEAENG